MPSVSRTLALPAFSPSTSLRTSRQRVLIFSVLWLLSVAPFFLLHSQWITGPFVNAVLILATIILGPAQAIVIGLFPGAIALASGLLPLPLAPMVPFIMIGNTVYVGVFHGLRKIPTKPRSPTNNGISSASSVSSIIIASVAKFLFLFLTAKFLIAPLLSGPITKTLITMMGWPQLITALIGGFIALAILTSFKPRA